MRSLTTMNDKQKDFLRKLGLLLDEYNVSISYTTDDDGLHLYMDGDEFYISWLDDPDEIRKDAGI